MQSHIFVNQSINSKNPASTTNQFLSGIGRKTLRFYEQQFVFLKIKVCSSLWKKLRDNMKHFDH